MRSRAQTADALKLKLYTHFFQRLAAVLFIVSLQACTRWSLLRDPKSLAVSPHHTVRVTTDGTPRHLIEKPNHLGGQHRLEYA
jgi:hypothetical protein